MQELPLQFDFIALILVLGLFLGFLISFYLIKKSRKVNLPNLFMGFFILSISLTMLEGWLNYTRLIFKILWATNFAEPLNFVLAPFIYLFVISQFKNFKKKKQWLHFLPFVFWLGYCVFFFMQPDVVKYNSNIDAMNADIPFIKMDYHISQDPFGIRTYVNLLTGLSFIIYNAITLKILFNKARSLGQTIWNTTNKTLIALRNAQYHFFIVIVIFIAVKLFFGNNDVGDYFIYLYITFMFFMTTVQIMNSSTYFNEVSTFLEGPVIKYQKSSLSERRQGNNTGGHIESNATRKSTLSVVQPHSLDLAKTINESTHHVSQVINEKLNQSFFEMLAKLQSRGSKSVF